MNIVSVAINWYLPYWPLFVLLIILGLAGAWAYLKYYATPVYETYATIMVKDEKKGVDESGVLEALQIYPTKNIVENEMEVIHSRKLMEKVVDQLQLYAPIYEGPTKGKMKATSAYTSSPIVISAKRPEDLKETGELDVPIAFTYDNDNNAGEFEGLSNRKPTEVIIDGKHYPLEKWCTTPYGELKFDYNEKLVEPAQGPLFFRLHRPKNIAPSFISNLEVRSASKLSTTITLVLKDEVPERGEDILNKLLVAYNLLSIEEKKGTAANTLEFIESRLVKVERELDSIENTIQSFRTSQGVVDLSQQSKQYLDNVGSNDRKIADLSMQLAALDEMERYVNSRENNTDDVVPAAVGISDPVLSDLMQKLYNAKVEYGKLMNSTAENNPFATAVAKEIEQTRPLILEKLRSHRINLEASKKDLTAISGNYNSMLRSIPQKERELMNISREQVIKKSIYNYLLEKREQTALASSSAVSDSKIIDYAKSNLVPVSPKKSLVYFAVLAGSIGLAIGLVSAREMLNKKILFRSEIESLTSVPVIAEIAANKESESLLRSGSKVSVVAEQFRHLRAAIGLVGRQKEMKMKRILITSSISSEGKTYISTNLARSLALAGNKVVLVDLDIRKPKTSTIMGVVDKPGVADFLEGTKEPEEIIGSSMDQNLYIVSAGSGIENAREQILSGRLTILLNYLNANFDYVILDASPIDPVSDSYVLSDYCDITLFIMRHGRTPKAMVQILDSNSKFKALKNPHIVFNGIRSRGIKGMYGYSYGYGYENVYREKPSRKSKLQRV